MGILITLPETASRLGVHVGTVRSWVRAGHIPSYRVGQRFVRVDWDEVRQHLARLRPAAPVQGELSSAHQGHRCANPADSGKELLRRDVAQAPGTEAGDAS